MNVDFAARLRLVAFSCLLLPQPVPAAGSLFDDYTQRSGLADQLALIANKGLVQIEAARADPQAQAPRLSDAQMARLRAAVEIAFAADRLRPAIRLHLDTLLPVGDTEQFLNWLDTPFGKRVTAIETAAAADEAPRRAAENASQTLAELAATRKADLERILKASGVEERTATMALALARAMALAAGAPAPDSGPAYGAADMLKNPKQDWLDPLRRRIVNALAPEALAYSAVVYAPLSDDELRAYAAVLERASTRRVIEATNVAFDRALSSAAIEVGRWLTQRN